MGLNQIDFNNFVRSFGITPVKLINNINNQWFTIISSMFVHGNLSHLIGNMVYLWIFGDNIEDSFGKVRFIIFYLLFEPEKIKILIFRIFNFINFFTAITKIC